MLRAIPKKDLKDQKWFKVLKIKLPNLDNTSQDRPMRQINPPFGIVILMFIRRSSANIDAWANNYCEENYGTNPTVEQVKEQNFFVTLPLTNV